MPPLFLEKVLEGKIITFEPPELVIVNKDCESYRESISDVEEDDGYDDILAAVLEEDAEKRR